jgi:predicted Zn-dependent peptidase
MLLQFHDQQPLPLPVAPSQEPGCRRTVLENGLRIVTEHIPETRGASIGVLIECGSRDESTEESGLAHLCEHLLFQETSSRSALQIARQMDFAGGQIGGFTTRDYTCLHAVVMGDHVYYALDLIGDVLLNSTFPEEALAREKSAIARELEGGSDVPSVRVLDLLKRKAWPGHALGRPIAGTAEAVHRHTREDLIYFFHRNYTPNRILIAAAGNINHDDFVTDCRDAFWRLMGDSQRPALVTPDFKQGVSFDHISSAQTYFAIGIPAPAYTYEGRVTTHLLTGLLGTGFSSRLFRRLREETGLVYDVHADYHAYAEAGMIVIEGATRHDTLEQAVDITLDTWNRLVAGEEPVGDEELIGAKNRLRSQHLIASGDVYTRMSRLATQELYFGRPLDGTEIQDRISSATAETVQQEAWRLGGANQQQPVHVAVAGPPLSGGS